LAYEEALKIESQKLESLAEFAGALFGAKKRPIPKGMKPGVKQGHPTSKMLKAMGIGRAKKPR